VNEFANLPELVYFEAVGKVVFLFLIPAVWQGQTNHSSIFSKTM
jgi:hypothetical protein